jgi:hypothetical protein
MFTYYKEEEDCFDCCEKENRLGDVKYWFRAVLDQLYGKEEFNSEELERYLEELGGYLDMKVPSTQLSVVRKDRTVEMAPMLDAWKQASVQYLKNLAKAGS